MLRNQRSRHDFMGMSNGNYPYNQPPMPPQAPVSQLDANSERLAEQAEDIGWLKGQNDMLNEDNQRLEKENQELRERNQTLQERSTRLEREDQAYSSVSEFIEDVKKSLKGAK